MTKELDKRSAISIALRTWPFVAVLALGMILGTFLFGGHSSHEGHEGHEGHEKESSSEGETYTCSMHPQIRSPQPGKCPICGMDLVKVEDNTTEDSGEAGVSFSERAKALARIVTVEVSRAAAGSGAGMKLLGRVEANEEGLRRVTAWTGGRIDRLHVRSTGEVIKAGQPVATLYSPEVYTAHQDLIVARKQIDRMKDGSSIAQRSSRAALSAARQRLELLGVPKDTLKKMEDANTPTRSIPIYSPYGGTVVERKATEGSYVETGAELYRLADLGTVWIQLEAYDSEIGQISVGQAAEVRVEGLDSVTFDGRVQFVDPTIDPEKRTGRVRVEVKNESGRLRPGMFATARLGTDSEDQSEASPPLVVPRTAPLFTGSRALIYVETKTKQGFHYAPREVRLGPLTGDVYPVVAGLSEGERIVERGAFAIDADLQIQGGPSLMAATLPVHATKLIKVDLTPDERSKLAPLVQAYLNVQEALAKDDAKGAKKSAQDLLTELRAAKITEPEVAVTAWESLKAHLREPTTRIAQSTSLETARAPFEHLSHAITELLGTFGNPTTETLSVAHCPMAMGSKGASWVQLGEKLRNSYFGASMLDCGEIEQSVDPGKTTKP